MDQDDIYLLDANVFIEAARRYYAFDVVPAFWNRLINYASENRILSIDRVKKELERGNDDLAEWINNGNLDHAFMSTEEEEVVRQFSEFMTWVQNNDQFYQYAKEEFANGVDGWLIAYAKVHNCIVVTHEQPSEDAKKRVKIPNVCLEFNVPYTDPFQMLRALGFKLE